MPESFLSPAERSLRAQVAAHARWAKEPDRLAATAPGRRAAFEKLLDEVDPDHKLGEAERAKRAQNLQRANLLRLSLRSAKLRKMRAAMARMEQVAAVGIESLSVTKADVGTRHADD
jgi:hypothetical protein